MSSGYVGPGGQWVTFTPQGADQGMRSAVRPYVKRPLQPMRKCWQGRLKNVATSGANHTTRVMTVLEAPTERIRIGILNSVAADLVNVRVRVTATDTMLGMNTSLAGTLSGSVSVVSAAFTAAAGTDVHAPTVTWSEWLSVAGLDRIDGGTLPAYMIAVEIPGSGNANRPAYDGTSRANWEDPAATNGRPWKQRGDAVLGATNNNDGTSTAFFEDGVPIIIEYMPRFGAVPLTLTCFGDSITEGAGAALRGYGWPYMLQAALSTPQRPIEICMLAASSASPTNIATRAEAMCPALKPELVLLQAHSPNAITAPTFTWNSTARSRLRQFQAALQACSAVDASVVLFSGVPMVSQPGEPAGGNKALDVEGAEALNRYMGLVLSSPWPTIDGYTPLSGPSNAEGQVTFGLGMTSDGIHPSEAGHLRISQAAAGVLSFLQIGI
jgi:lysophospholipase L1-like esterase